MCFDVPFQMACLWWCIIALCAIVWLLPTVDEHVLFQGSSITKEISTFCTFVYFLPSVGDHVPPQRPCFTKWFLTFWASVGFHSTVGEYVPFQMICFTKWLLAFWTLVHLVSSAGEHMSLHLIWDLSLTLSNVACVKLEDESLSRKIEGLDCFHFHFFKTRAQLSIEKDPSMTSQPYVSARDGGWIYKNDQWLATIENHIAILSNPTGSVFPKPLA